MFGKLLKYDLRSMLKTFALIWGAALVLALVNRVTLSNIDTNQFFGTGRILSIVLFVGVLVATAVLALIFIVQRFYKGLLGEEGYLMFTLPVKSWQLILSKAVSAVIVLAVSSVVAGVSLCIMASASLWLRGFMTVQIPSMFDDLRQELSLSGFSFAVVIAELIVLSLLDSAVGIYQIYAAIALGHLFRKHRVILSFVMYLLLNSAVSTFSSRFIFLGVNSHAFASFTHWLRMLADGGKGLLAANIVLAGLFLLIVLQLAVFHLITERILSKRLNLE